MPEDGSPEEDAGAARVDPAVRVLGEVALEQADGDGLRGAVMVRAVSRV